MALSNLDILFYGFSVVSVIILCLILALELRIRKLLHGKNARNIGDTIQNFGKDLEELKDFHNEASAYLAKSEERISKSIQGVETVRFNPFKGTGSGGNQSFSTAFLNERGDGVIFSSLYSRERVSTFSKPLKNFTSEYELTEEEREAIVKARASLKTTKKA